MENFWQSEQPSSNWEQESLQTAMALLDRNHTYPSMNAVYDHLFRIPFLDNLGLREYLQISDMLSSAASMIPTLYVFLEKYSNAHGNAPISSADYNLLILNPTVPGTFNFERRAYMIALTYIMVKNVIGRIYEKNEQKPKLKRGQITEVEPREFSVLLHYTLILNYLCQVHTLASILVLGGETVSFTEDSFPEDSIPIVHGDTYSVNLIQMLIIDKFLRDNALVLGGGELLFDPPA